MKKLNIMLSFVLLSFCLLINVSNAEIPANTVLRFTSAGESTSTSNVNGLTYNQLNALAIDYIDNGNQEAMDTLFEAYKTVGCTSYFWYAYTASNNVKYRFVYFIKEPVDIGLSYSSDDGSLKSCIVNTEYDTTYGAVFYLRAHGTGSDAPLKYSGNNYTRNYVISSGKSYEDYAYDYYFPEDIRIKKIEYSTVANTYSWDGVSYVTEDEEPDTPSLPSNAEIAQAVQAFYDSDYYKNATDFDKFIVLYDKITGLYLFIGHTIPEFLQQTIIPPNYRYQDYMYDAQWWKFELSENSGAPAYGTPYYLYVIDNKLENLEYRGKSTISSLVESGPWATSNTIIVYSNYDYLVRTYVLDEETGDYVYTDGTIAGNQYTYDENLDITDNKYNPLDNFVTVNYPSTLVGNADFDSFLNTFNKNKDVLILPQNTNWVILSNIALFGHFSSFIIMCTLFIILERVMRG